VRAVPFSLLATSSQVVETGMSMNRQVDSQGQHLKSFAVMHDVTRRNQLLRRRDQMLEALGKSNQELVNLTGVIANDLEALLPRCVESLRAKIHACQVACIVEGDLSVVTIGASQLERMIHNLIDNAMRYRVQDRVPAIHLTVTREGALVEISVTDNGQGFDEANSEALFESFKRDARADRLQEKGVGLAICRRIITQAGGTIRATSGADVGSRFISQFTDHTMA
jgi:signal transduction histidine kinase